MGYNQLQNGSMCDAHGKSISNCISVLTAPLHSGAAGTWISAPEEILAFHMFFSCSIRKQQIFCWFYFFPPRKLHYKNSFGSAGALFRQKVNFLRFDFGFVFMQIFQNGFQRDHQGILLQYILFFLVFYTKLFKGRPFQQVSFFNEMAVANGKHSIKIILTNFSYILPNCCFWFQITTGIITGIYLMRCCVSEQLVEEKICLGEEHIKIRGILCFKKNGLKCGHVGMSLGESLCSRHTRMCAPSPLERRKFPNYLKPSQQTSHK